jgi:hypothetical protein
VAIFSLSFQAFVVLLPCSSKSSYILIHCSGKLLIIKINEKCTVLYILNSQRWSTKIRHAFRVSASKIQPEVLNLVTLKTLTAELSKASTVYDSLNIQIAGSNSARGMDVCLLLSVLCCSVFR